MSENTTIHTSVTKRNVGKCPACCDYLWGEVTIETEVANPHWNETTNRPTPRAVSRAVGMVLSHECEKSEESDV